MKTIINTLAFIFILSLAACDNKVHSEYEYVLGGNHILRKFNVKTTTSQSSSAFYFFVAGSYSSSTYSNTKVRFYFLNFKGEYQLMEQSLNDVNIKIDNNVVIPYVRFYWAEHPRYREEWKTMYQHDVTGAVIYCKESDFQPEININDLK